jgi:hypothetical protein
LSALPYGQWDDSRHAGLPKPGSAASCSGFGYA